MIFPGFGDAGDRLFSTVFDDHPTSHGIDGTIHHENPSEMVGNSSSSPKRQKLMENEESLHT